MALMLLVISCSSAADADMRDVVSDFIAGINAQDLGAIRECLDADARDYGEDLAFWTDAERFGTATDYVLASFEELTDTTAAAAFTSQTGNDPTYYFKMTDGGSTYYIRLIDDDADLSSPSFQ